MRGSLWVALLSPLPVWLALGCGGAPSDGGAGERANSAGTGSEATGDAGGPVAGSGGMAGGTGAVEAACSDGEPCGGEVVGSWTVLDSCLVRSGSLSVLPLGLGCATAAVTESLQVRGTWTAHGDGTVTDELSWSGEVVLTLAPECLQLAMNPSTCPPLANPLTLLGTELPITSLDCAGDPATDGCTCRGNLERLPTGGSGSYAIADDRVTTSGGLAFSYCVEQDTLTFTPLAWTVDAPAEVTTTGSVIAAGTAVGSGT